MCIRDRYHSVRNNIFISFFLHFFLDNNWYSIFSCLIFHVESFIASFILNRLSSASFIVLLPLVHLLEDLGNLYSLSHCYKIKACNQMRHSTRLPPEDIVINKFSCGLSSCRYTHYSATFPALKITDQSEEAGTTPVSYTHLCKL